MFEFTKQTFSTAFTRISTAVGSANLEQQNASSPSKTAQTDNSKQLAPSDKLAPPTFPCYPSESNQNSGDGPTLEHPKDEDNSATIEIDTTSNFDQNFTKFGQANNSSNEMSLPLLNTNSTDADNFYEEDSRYSPIYENSSVLQNNYTFAFAQNYQEANIHETIYNHDAMEETVSGKNDSSLSKQLRTIISYSAKLV